MIEYVIGYLTGETQHLFNRCQAVDGMFMRNHDQGLVSRRPFGCLDKSL
jgi:hypothetical protein